MPRYALTLEYDGGPYAGWQRQHDRLTVQSALGEALFALSGERAECVGAGRTDAGVHASGQVAHVDLEREWDPFRIMQGMNFHLLSQGQPGISVIAAAEAAPEFHARFSATSRRYIYRILNRRARPAVERGRVWHVPVPLDAEAMQEAAARLLGSHDFTSFRDSECQAKSPLKTLDILTVRRVGAGGIEVETKGRSFLHHQVRIMVGTLAEVGFGKWSADDVTRALEASDRRVAGPTAPAEGLYLVEVEY